MLTRHDADALQQVVHDFAAQQRYGDGRVYFEPVAPEILVRDMLAEVDRSVPVMNLLKALAPSWRVDLGRIFAPTHRRADLLWRILRGIPDATDVEFIVASEQHLSNLDFAGQAALYQLTNLPALTVHYLDATDHASASDSGLVAEVDTQHERVVVESRVGAIPAAAQLDAAEALTRNRWPEAMGCVDAVYVALIADRVHTTPQSLWIEPSPTPDAMIRLLVHTATGALIIELDEPHPRHDQPPEALVALCENVRRHPSGGHTITRCTLPTRVNTTGEPAASPR
ncbi:hypothetical protein OG225_06400 [Nocardia sp. NBC_01377]